MVFTIPQRVWLLLHFAEVVLLTSSTALPGYLEARERAIRQRNSVESVLRIGVCITGQMGRLEVESKARNIFRTNLLSTNLVSWTGVPREGKRFVDAVFVLTSPNETSFTNGATPGARMSQFKDAADILAVIDDVVGVPRGHVMRAADRLRHGLLGAADRLLGRPEQDLPGVAGLHEPPAFSVGVHIVTPDPDPPIRDWYITRLDKTYMNRTERVARVASHINQWKSAQECFKHLTALEKARGHRYDIVLKVRDDSIALAPMDLSKLPWRGHLLTKNCLNWEGVNDKVAVFDRKWASQVLEGPLNLYRDITTEPAARAIVHFAGFRVINPETYLRAVFSFFGVPSLPVSPRALPVTSGRLQLPSQQSAVDTQPVICYLWRKLQKNENATCFPEKLTSYLASHMCWGQPGAKL